MNTLRELEKITGIKAKTLKAAARHGRLAAKKLGRDWFSTPNDVKNWVEKSNKNIYLKNQLKN
jgi:hypothetical protein